MADTAIFDIDGTLVDTNYHHAVAWYRAFRRHDLTLPIWRIHRSIGMGGDQLVPALAGEDWESAHGDDVRATEEDFDRELIDEVEPLPGARELIERLKDEGHAVVLASSAKQDEVDHYLDLLAARELVDAWTTSDDVEVTKPAPDLVPPRSTRSAATRRVMVGDSTYDCEAAARADVPTVALLTGGFSREELSDAGRAAVFESLGDLRARSTTPRCPGRRPEGAPSRRVAGDDEDGAISEDLVGRLHAAGCVFAEDRRTSCGTRPAPPTSSSTSSAAGLRRAARGGGRVHGLPRRARAGRPGRLRPSGADRAHGRDRDSAPEGRCAWSDVCRRRPVLRHRGCPAGVPEQAPGLELVASDIDPAAGRARDTASSPTAAPWWRTTSTRRSPTGSAVGST